ncbi:MAG: hypothetical protein JW812_03435 [Alphaproteobacteria bacterium]|nr:hypothetical protein [Alphaproteobacteria bacterium]
MMDQNEFEIKKFEINSSQNETFLNNLIDLAKLMLHSAIYVNGGALIALLTFLGNSRKKISSEFVIPAFSVFSVGLVLGLIACIFAFFAQLRFQQDLITNSEENFVKRAEWNRSVALVCVFGSIASFLIGCFLSIFSIV